MKVKDIVRNALDIFGLIFVFLSILIVFKGGIAFIPIAVFFLILGIALGIERNNL